MAVEGKSEEFDEKLRLDLEQFGETIPKITDKNREILVKKLNHLRARKRMSEKLEKPPSPKKGGKGRTKKQALSGSGDAKPETLTAPDSDSAHFTVQSETNHVQLDDEIRPPPAKRSRKGDSRSADVEQTAPKVLADTVAVVKPVPEPKTVMLKNKGRKSAVPTSSAAPIIEDKRKSSESSTSLREMSVVMTRVSAADHMVAVTTDSVVPETAGNLPSTVGASVAEKSSTGKPAQKKGRRTVAKTLSVEETGAGDSPTLTEEVRAEPADNGVPVTVDRRNQAQKRGRKSVAPSHSVASVGSDSEINGKMNGSRIPVPKLARPQVPSVLDTSASLASPLLSRERFSASAPASDCLKLSMQVIDASQGRPAACLPVTLFIEEHGAWKKIGMRMTDAAGYCSDLASSAAGAGKYRLLFDAAAYFSTRRVTSFFQHVNYEFQVDSMEHPVRILLTLGPSHSAINAY